MTACTAWRYGDHDYSQPPHNEPGRPRLIDAEDPCQAGLEGCADERRYEVVVYQAASHEWIRMFACTPCTAGLRQRHHRFGPRGSEGIARVRDAERGVA